MLIWLGKVGPRDLETHSKWPNFMQLHGSITPRMLLPMLMITLWSIIVTAISAKTKPRELISVYGVKILNGN